MSKTHKALLQMCEYEIRPDLELSTAATIKCHEFIHKMNLQEKPLMVGTRTISRKQIVCYAEMAILRSAKSCGG